MGGIMIYHKTFLSVLVIHLAMLPFGRAQNAPAFEAVPDEMTDFTGVPMPNVAPDSKTYPGYYRVNVMPTCYAANLRSISNPVDPEGNLNLRLKFKANNLKSDFSSTPFAPYINGTNKFVTLRFPAKVILAALSTSGFANKVWMEDAATKDMFKVIGEDSAAITSQRLLCTQNGAAITAAAGNLMQLRSIYKTIFPTHAALIDSKPLPELGSVAACSKLAQTLNLDEQVLKSSSNIAAVGNVVTFALNGVGAKTVSVNEFGDVSEAATGAAIDTIQFYQTDTKWANSQMQHYSGQAYYTTQYQGWEGPVDQNMVDGGREYSTDGSTVTIKVSFPMESGTCGSYWSPLMAFFDGKRPEFSGTSAFPLAKNGSPIAWPERNAPGYFLALDINRNGKIDRASELFTHLYHKNGFEDLRRFDSNRDKMIDKNDPIFEKLVLWNDKNGDGNSSKSELKTLAQMKVEHISLKYQAGTTTELKHGAQFRERSTFRANGKDLEIIDVWFSQRALLKVAR